MIPNSYDTLKAFEEELLFGEEPKRRLPSLTTLMDAPKTSLFSASLLRQTALPPLSFAPKRETHYFHATKLKNISGILRDREISLPSKASGVTGAYVSTLPEPTFGDYVLIFNEKIAEDRPAPIKTDCWRKSRCWIAHGSPIPVNPDTLVAIAVSKEAELSIKAAADLFSKWAGRPIKVIPLTSPLVF